MSPRFLTSLLLAAALVPVAAAVTTQATAPVGFMRYRAGEGMQTVGFPLVNAPVFSGVVTEVGNDSLTTVLASGSDALSVRLDPQTAYYVEFTADPAGDATFVGDRYEVDVSATIAAADDAGRVRVSCSSTRSTLGIVPADLVGYHFVLRAHVTLASAFGTGSASALQAGRNTANGDQVHVLRDGAFDTYLFQANAATGVKHWVKFPEGTPADQLPIAPGHGVFLRRVGAGEVSFEHLGRVRTNAFVQPLNAGYTLASEPFPVASTFTTRGMTNQNGFVAGDSSETSDKVFVWEGATYRALFYASTAGATPDWRSSGTTSQAVEGPAGADFSPYRAVLIEKLQADPAYVVPSPL